MDRKAFFTVLVAALGYFVDVYDLILFSVVRVASLKGIGLDGQALTDSGVFLLNTQLGGMLLGGILWGVLGDRKGRLKILFGSILLYSLANIANAFVATLPAYAVCRFLAGLGLAGEIGAGITLVGELLPKEHRGLGTTLVAAVGVAGGLVAALVGDFFAWKTAYLVGGGMGLALFVLRVSVSESGLFADIENKTNVRRGDLRLLLGNASCLKRFIACVLIGLPLWYLAGLIVTFAPEIGKNLNLAEDLSAGKAVLWFYGGLVGGDLGSGLLSQKMKSRRKALALFILAAFVLTLALLNLPQGATAATYYKFCGLTGFFAGYWAMFLTTTSEHFGTNLRATVTTAVPNLVRGGVIVLSSAFAAMKGPLGVTFSLEVIAAAVFGAALLSVWLTRETFGCDLAFTEE